jgi:hypothetical protein
VEIPVRGTNRPQFPRWGQFVYCGGRWGNRRVRTDECRVLTTENLYTSLLSDDRSRLAAGGTGTVTYQVDDRTFTAAFEIRANAVWRYGRPFLRCSKCRRLCTRLYLPNLMSADLACRSCWGLTYASRSLQTYRDSLYGRGRFARLFGETQRERSFEATLETRARRREACLERWALRRESDPNASG